jgi:hypothetical protein
MCLLLIKAGKPLAVIGSFKGAFNQASVYPNTLLAEALRIEGAAKAWGVHNHPSGISTLSRADQQLSRAISSTFDASSVQWQGVAAIGVEPGTNDQGRFEAVDDKGNPLEGALITGKSSVNVPIVERTILRQNALMPAITSPDSADVDHAMGCTT